MEAIRVVTVVVSFTSLPRNTHDSLSVHASCISLYVCMIYPSVLIHYLVHGLNLADTIYAH